MSDKTQDIVGKTIESVSIDKDREVLRFQFADGTHTIWTAVGDCCSHSWFEHVDATDFRGTVLRVEDADGGESGDRNVDSECILITFTTIYTDRGRLHIEMRNSSNGYYSGWIEVGETVIGQYGDVLPMPTEWKAVA